MELTLSEVATRLKVPLDTIHRWIRQGKIPVHSRRGEYVIHLDILERWAAEHKLQIRTPARSERCHQPASESLPAAMQGGGVLFNIRGDNKEAVLNHAVSLIPNVRSAERDLIYEKLIEREHLASTGIGHGIALPHPRATLTLTLPCAQITTCYLKQPIDYGAIDNKPVSVLMIILSTSTKEHLTLLSRTAFCLRDPGFRGHLLQHPEPDELFDLVTRMEAQHAH